MKNQIKKIAIPFCLSFVSSLAFAQVPPPENPPSTLIAGQAPPPPKPRGPKERRDRRSMQPVLQSLVSINGKVTGYQTNEKYAYNGLTLDSNGKTITVRFPEHMGQQLMNAAKKGETITIKGFNNIGPDGVSNFQLVSASIRSIQISDTPAAPPVQPAIQEQKSYSGTITDFKRGLNGETNGILLDNKTIVELPPAASSQLQSLLKIGEKVEVSGFKRITPSGVVLASNAPTFVHPQTIAFNGQTYLVR